MCGCRRYLCFGCRARGKSAVARFASGIACHAQGLAANRVYEKGNAAEDEPRHRVDSASAAIAYQGLDADAVACRESRSGQGFTRSHAGVDGQRPGILGGRPALLWHLLFRPRISAVGARASGYLQRYKRRRSRHDGPRRLLCVRLHAVWLHDGSPTTSKAWTLLPGRRWNTSIRA